MLDIELAHVSQQMVQHTPALVTLKNQSVLYSYMLPLRTYIALLGSCRPLIRKAPPSVSGVSSSYAMIFKQQFIRNK